MFSRCFAQVTFPSVDKKSENSSVSNHCRLSLFLIMALLSRDWAQRKLSVSTYSHLVVQGDSSNVTVGDWNGSWIFQVLKKVKVLQDIAVLVKLADVPVLNDLDMGASFMSSSSGWHVLSLSQLFHFPSQFV